MVGRKPKRTLASVEEDETRLSNIPAANAVLAPIPEEKKKAVKSQSNKRGRKRTKAAAEEEEEESVDLTAQPPQGKVEDSLSLTPLDSSVLSALEPPPKIPSIRSTGITTLQQQQQQQQEQQEIYEDRKRKLKYLEEQRERAQEREEDAARAKAAKQLHLQSMSAGKSERKNGGATKGSAARDIQTATRTPNNSRSGSVDESKSSRDMGNSSQSVSTSVSSRGRANTSQVARSRPTEPMSDGDSDEDSSTHGSEQHGMSTPEPTAEVKPRRKRRGKHEVREEVEKTKGKPLFLDDYEKLVAHGARLLPSELNCWDCTTWKPITDFSSADFKKITRKCCDCLRKSQAKKIEADMAKRSERNKEVYTKGEKATELLKQVKELQEKLLQKEKDEKEIMAKMNKFFIKAQQEEKVKSAKSWEEVTPRADVEKEFNTREHRMQQNDTNGMLDTGRFELPWNDPKGKPIFREFRKGARSSGDMIGGMREEMKNGIEGGGASSSSTVATRTHSSSSAIPVHFPLSPLLEPFTGQELPEFQHGYEQEERKE